MYKIETFTGVVQQTHAWKFNVVRTCMLCYVCRLLTCNKRTYYTTEIHKIMKMQMNKKKEKEHSILHK